MFNNIEIIEVIHSENMEAVEGLHSENRRLRQRLVDMEHMLQESYSVEQALCDLKSKLLRGYSMFQQIFNNASSLIMVKDAQGRYIFANQRVMTAWNLDSGQIIGKTDHDLFPEEFANTVQTSDRQVLTTGNSIECEEVTPLADGLHTYMANKFPIYDEHGIPYALAIIANDITLHKQMEQRNRDAALINGMCDFLHDCPTLKDAYYVIVRVVEKLFARQPGALYALNPTTKQAEVVARWGEPAVEEQAFALDECLALKQGYVRISESGQEDVCTHLPNDGASGYVCIPLIAHGETLGMLHLRNSQGTSAVMRKRSEWIAMMLADRLALSLANLQLRERLRVQAVRDPLTNLFNRRYLDETLERELQRAERHNHPVGVIILDIDHFKEFNTIHGLRGGDAALRAVGKFLQTSIRGEDVACRFGGEEFTLVLPHASLDDTCKRAEQLRERIRNLKVVYNGRILRPITVSLGVSCFPLHGTTVETVISAADQALGRAKAEGRDRVVIAELL